MTGADKVAVHTQILARTLIGIPYGNNRGYKVDRNYLYFSPNRQRKISHGSIRSERQNGNQYDCIERDKSRGPPKEDKKG